MIYSRHDALFFFFVCVCVVLRVLDCVFAFLQLRDVQLGFAAVQPLEPDLVVVDGGDDGATRHRHTTTQQRQASC